MTIVFTYSSFITLLFATLPIIIGYCMLINAGALEWETMQFPNLLMFMGLVNIIFNLARFFIPAGISVVNGTFLDTSILISYVFSSAFILFLLESIILGIPLIFMGIKNMNQYGPYLILMGGVLIIERGLRFYLFGILQLQVAFGWTNASNLILWTFIAGSFSVLPFIILIQYGNKIQNNSLIFGGSILIFGKIMLMPVVDTTTLGFFFGFLLVYILLIIIEVIILLINRSQIGKNKEDKNKSKITPL